MKLYAVSKQNVVLSIFQPCDEKFCVRFKTSFLLLLLFVECFSKCKIGEKKFQTRRWWSLAYKCCIFGSNSFEC